jgi:hypothetical protein
MRQFGGTAVSDVVIEFLARGDELKKRNKSVEI